MSFLKPTLHSALWLFWILAAACVAGLFLPSARASGYYSSPWISGLMGLLGIASILCAIHAPLRQIARILSHVGFAFVFFGAGLSGLFGQRGFLTLAEGESASSFSDEKGGRRDLGGQVALLKFEMETYGKDLGELVLAQESPSEEWVPLDRVSVAEGASGALGDWTVEILKVAPTTPGMGGMVTVRATKGETSIERPLFSEMPMLHSELGDGLRLFYLYQPEVKSYRSTLSVEDGKGSHRNLSVEVNRPGSWRGWSLYQSSYSSQDGRLASTLEVVRDPGVGVVFAGYLFAVLGAVWGLPGRKGGP